MVELQNSARQHGSQVLFVDTGFTVNPGEKVGLVGANGSGKTTVFRLIVGEERADEGTVERPKKLTVAYFRQDFAEWGDRSVLEETMAGASDLTALGRELGQLEARLGDVDAPDYDRVLDRYSEAEASFSALGGYTLEPRARALRRDPA